MTEIAPGDIGALLNLLLEQAGQPTLDPIVLHKFERYLQLLQRWNAKTNLTSIRDVDGSVRRHFLESILCANLIPKGLKTLLDYGSGAGFPGLPIAICRPDLSVELAEAHGKKVAFLSEAVRLLDVLVVVSHLRAETLPGPYDVVALRAVEHMAEAVANAAAKVGQSGYLALIVSSRDVDELHVAAGGSFEWTLTAIPDSDSRVIAMGKRSESV